MSNRSRFLADQKIAMNGNGDGQPIPTIYPPPPKPYQSPQQPPPITDPSQIVPALAAMGAPISYGLGFDPDARMFKLVVSCGPIHIPMELTADQARGLADIIITKCDETAVEVIPLPHPEAIECPLPDPENAA